MELNQPTIVVALFNRKEPALRLLSSLAVANYPANKEVNLIISIDNDQNRNLDVKELAENFPWKFGKKEIIFHPKNLGIRDHFNFCGDLSLKYGSVIFLEDDLYVSKYFYYYLLQAMDFYKDEKNVAGISLFSYNRIEQKVNPLPFTAIDDGYDNYFLQQASWGQLWTEKMWSPFKKWFAKNGKNEIINAIPVLPDTIKAWPGNSWKKYYISYMIINEKYYVFPRSSLATNFDDVGVNRKCNTVYYQSPLLVGEKKFNFSRFHESKSVYDSYFELLPGIIKQLNPSMSEFDFEVNLYGNKKKHNSDKVLFLSRSRGFEILKSFKLTMKPHELNVVFGQGGDGIYLCDKNKTYEIKPMDKFMNDFFYFYRDDFSPKELLMIFTFKIRKKLRQYFKF